MRQVDYISTIDISQPFGPSTNEYETVKYLIKNCNSLLYLPVFHGKVDIPTNRIKHFNWLGKGPLIPLYGIRVIVKDTFTSRRKTPLLIRLDQAGILWLIPFLCWVLRRPFHLIHLQDPIEAILERKNKSPLKKYLMIRWFNLIVGLSKTIETTQIEFLNHYHKRFPEKKIEIVPHGVDVNRFKPDLKSKSKVVVGFCGGFPIDRGGKQVVEIVKYFKSKGILLNGLVVGDSKNNDGTSEASTLTNLVQEYDLQDQIEVSGYVSYSEVHNFFKRIDIGIALVPEIELHERGNSSQKIFQYLACGSHVIIPKATHTEIENEDFVHSCDWDQSNLFSLVDSIIQRKEELLKNDCKTAIAKYAERKYSIEAKFQKRFELWFNQS